MTATQSPPQQEQPPQLAGRRYLALVLLGVVVGLPAAFVAALFLGLVHEAQQALWPDDPAWYLVVGLPVVGAAIVAGARAFLPGDGFPAGSPGREPCQVDRGGIPVGAEPGGH